MSTILEISLTAPVMYLPLRCAGYAVGVVSGLVFLYLTFSSMRRWMRLTSFGAYGPFVPAFFLSVMVDTLILTWASGMVGEGCSVVTVALWGVMLVMTVRDAYRYREQSNRIMAGITGRD